MNQLEIDALFAEADLDFNLYSDRVRVADRTIEDVEAERKAKREQEAAIIELPF